MKNNQELAKDALDGWVTLTGNPAWNYQKDAASDAVRHLAGIKVLTNKMRIQPENEDQLEQQAIQRALYKSSAMEGQDIQIYVTGNNFTLNSIVNSLFQQSQASQIAWKAPSVSAVDNKLAIKFRD